MGLDLDNQSPCWYALGHKSEFTTGLIAEFGDQDDLSLFVKWCDQPANEDLPKRPDLCNQQTVKLGSFVLGCAFDLSMPNEPPFVELGESFSAAIEGALATGIVRGMIAREPRFTVTIRESDFCNEPFEYAVDDESGYPQLSIKCRKFDPDGMSVEEQRSVENAVWQKWWHIPSATS